jgi:phage baseplate assembly protein W
MANIKLKNIEVSDLDNASLTDSYLYKDVLFDLNPQYTYNAQINKKERLRDIDALFDEEAVRNSVVNCFLTSPGQKILNPEFGVDLRDYLFDPISQFTTEFIKMVIEDKLPLMEPRISLQNVSVIANEEEQQYDVTLEIDIPSLNVYGLSLKGKLNNNGYTLV